MRGQIETRQPILLVEIEHALSIDELQLLLGSIRQMPELVYRYFMSNTPFLFIRSASLGSELLKSR